MMACRLSMVRLVLYLKLNDVTLLTSSCVITGRLSAAGLAEFRPETKLSSMLWLSGRATTSWGLGIAEIELAELSATIACTCDAGCLLVI